MTTMRMREEDEEEIDVDVFASWIERTCELAYDSAAAGARRSSRRVMRMVVAICLNE